MKCRNSKNPVAKLKTLDGSNASKETRKCHGGVSGSWGRLIVMVMTYLGGVLTESFSFCGIVWIQWRLRETQHFQGKGQGKRLIKYIKAPIGAC